MFNLGNASTGSNSKFSNPLNYLNVALSITETKGGTDNERKKVTSKAMFSLQKLKRIDTILSFQNGEAVKRCVNAKRHCLKIRHIFGRTDFSLFFMPHTVKEYNFPVSIYLFKINNENTKTFCEIYSKLTTKTPDRLYGLRSGVLIVNFE